MIHVLPRNQTVAHNIKLNFGLSIQVWIREDDLSIKLSIVAHIECSK